jgi:hypothetical protein
MMHGQKNIKLPYIRFCVRTFGIQTSIDVFDPCQYLSHSSIVLSALYRRLPINQVIT